MPRAMLPLTRCDGSRLYRRVEEQWYRMDATRENIEEIMHGEAQRFVAEHP